MRVAVCVALFCPIAAPVIDDKARRSAYPGRPLKPRKIASDLRHRARRVGLIQFRPEQRPPYSNSRDFGFIAVLGGACRSGRFSQNNPYLADHIFRLLGCGVFRGHDHRLESDRECWERIDKGLGASNPSRNVGLRSPRTDILRLERDIGRKMVFKIRGVCVRSGVVRPIGSDSHPQRLIHLAPAIGISHEPGGIAGDLTFADWHARRRSSRARCLSNGADGDQQRQRLRFDVFAIGAGDHVPFVYTDVVVASRPEFHSRSNVPFGTFAHRSAAFGFFASVMALCRCQKTPLTARLQIEHPARLPDPSERGELFSYDRAQRHRVVNSRQDPAGRSHDARRGRPADDGAATRFPEASKPLEAGQDARVNSVEKMSSTMDSAGVIFVAENGEGPAVRSRKGIVTITGAQVKAARELIKWSQSKLAAETGVSVASIVKFEGGGQRPSMLDLSVVERMLKDGGIDFVDGEPGVRMKNAARTGKEPPAVSDEPAPPDIPEKDGESYDGAPV
jgi:transcriptional regulator with XRE-family HTH domain